MKGFPVMVAVVLLAGMLALANGGTVPTTTAPTTTTPVVIVPSTTVPVTTTATVPSTTTTTTTTMPLVVCPTATAPTMVYPSATVPPTVMTTTIPTTVTTTALPSTSCPYNVSQDTACLMSELSSLRSEVRNARAEIRAASLELRGQQLVSRMNQLMTDELLFRQQISMNPNFPGSQVAALSLSSEAAMLNQDIAAFSNELALIPADLRPYMATRLQTFEAVYWNPALQRFATYRSQFPQLAAVYQNAYQANPWLQGWVGTYQASINALSQTPQMFASARWWSNTAVLGTTEAFPQPSTSTMPAGSVVLPPGSVIYIPPSVAAGSSGMPMQ